MFQEPPSDTSTQQSVRIETLGGEPSSRRPLIRHRRSKTRIEILLAAAAVATCLVLAGCNEDGAFTSEDLIGTWRVSALDFRQFSPDGSFRVFLAEQNPDTSTVDRGQFEIEGTLLTFISNQDSAACAAGQRGNYEIQVLDAGPSGEDRLKLIHVDDECSKRGSEGDRTLARVP